MKVRHLKKVVLFLVLLLVPGMVSASSNFKVTSLWIDADIDIAGSMNVTELIIIEGSVNEFKRDLNFKDPTLPDWRVRDIVFENTSMYLASEVRIRDVSAKRLNSMPTGFDIFTEESRDEFEPLRELESLNREEGTFFVSEIDNGIRLNMHYPAENEIIAFLISYVVVNVVVIHNDVAELYWPFVRDFNDEIEDIFIRLLLPELDPSGLLQAWGHTNAGGTLSYINNEDDVPGGVFAHYKNYVPGNQMTIRMLFDPDLIMVRFLPKETEVDALDAIIAFEEEKIAEEERRQKRMQILFYGSIAISIICLGIILKKFIYPKFIKNKSKDKIKVEEKTKTIKATAKKPNKKQTKK